MKNKTLNKEAFKQFIDELFKTKFSKEAIKELFHSDEMEELLSSMETEDDEEEVCIEPFVFIDEEGNVLDYKEMQQYGYDEEELYEFISLEEAMSNIHPEACPSIEEGIVVKEEDIEFIPLEEVELNASEMEEIQKIAEQIEPIRTGLMIPCFVDGKEQFLEDKVNCNIKQVPLLGINLVSPVNLEVLKVYLDSDMESEDEIELSVALRTDDKFVVFKFRLGDLLSIGVLAIVDSLELSLDLSAVGYRGITSKVELEEFVNILN